jgi:hypothetical protein
MKIIDANRWAAVASAAVCVVLITAIAILSTKPAGDTILKRPSTFFTDSSGAGAIFIVLQKVLPSASQWRVPITELQPPSRQTVATLIAMQPGTFGQGEAMALDNWIEAGGQLILVADTDWRVQKTPTDQTTKDFLARHGIAAPARRNTTPTADNAINKAVTKQVGEGRIIYVPDAYAFSNSTLRTTDNAVWLVDRCNEWGGGVLFDEYHLGFASQRAFSSILASFLITPWGLVFLQFALAGGVYILGYKRRFGSPLEELPLERTNPIETVQAVAGLFESAKARTLCAKTIHQYLNAHVSSLMGCRVDLMDPASRERLAGPLRVDKHDLDSYAQAAKAAISQHAMSDAELIRFGQQATSIARSFTHGNARNRYSAAAG